MPHDPNQFQPRTRTWSRFAAPLLGLTAVLVIGATGFRQPTSHVEDAARVADGLADETRCAECHEQAETFWETGHARTLQRATAEESLTLLRRMNDANVVNTEGTRINVGDDRVTVINNSGGVQRALEIDWCFGSGDHARTWVATMTDSMGATDLLEFRWSHFHDGDLIGLTPAQPEMPMHGAYGKLGVFFDGPKARGCFSCHALLVPGQASAIDEAHIMAGVTCQRCHGPRAEHVASEGAVIKKQWQPPATQHDAVDRCAQCHRRAEDQDIGTVTTDNVNIVRFQPIGLGESACFKQSGMTCVTCHDPHKPLSAQDSTGIWQCLQCHSPDQASHTTCAAGEVDDCLRCHMPKVRMTAPVSFTDHWIRVRDGNDDAP